MSLSQKKPTISIPEFRKPDSPQFSAFGLSTSPNGNGTSLLEDPTVLADRQAAEQVRRDLIGSLGIAPNTDQFTKTFFDKSLSIAQPQLENSLIQRGLGGSSVYQGALTDLITKASQDAILNGQQYGINDQSSKLNTLAGLQSSYFAPYQALGQNLLQLAASTGISQDQLAQALYQMQLPYTAQVNYPKQSGLGGAINGGIQGFMTGGPVGAITGAGVGYLGSQAPAYSQPYMLSDYAKNSGGLNLQSLQGLLKMGGF